MKRFSGKQLRGKRIVWPKKETVEIESFEIRDPEEKQVLIEAAKTAISPGTEIAFLRAMPNTPGKFPMYPGWCHAGTITQVGSKVTNFKIGDRVFSWSHHASHALASEERRVLPIPENLSFSRATFINLASIALLGIRRAQIELGESVAVIGQGPVGLLALQLAKLSGGLPVVGIDLIDRRLEVSSGYGADYTLNPNAHSFKNKVADITQGKGFNVIIEVTGNPEAIARSLKLAGKHARMVLLGSARGESRVNFYSDVHKKGVHMIGVHDSLRPCYESSAGRWTLKEDCNVIIALLSKDRLGVDELISEEVSFLDAPQAYKKIIENKETVITIVLNWVR